MKKKYAVFRESVKIEFRQPGSVRARKRLSGKLLDQYIILMQILACKGIQMMYVLLIVY